MTDRGTVALASEHDAGEVPMVFIHGGTDSRNGWNRLRAHLPDRLDTWFVDLAGHGESPWADRYTIADHVADTAEFIETHFDGPVHVVGHSIGGMTVFYLAARHPELVRTAFVEDANPFEFTDEFLATNPVVAMAKRFRETVARFRTDNMGLDWLRDQYLSSEIGSGRTLGSVSPGPWHDDARVACWAAADWRIIDPVLDGSILAGLDPETDLSTISCPIHVAVAEPKLGGVMPEDVVARVQATVPGVQITNFGASHAIHNDKPQELTDLIVSHVDSEPNT